MHIIKTKSAIYLSQCTCICTSLMTMINIDISINCTKLQKNKIITIHDQCL